LSDFIFAACRPARPVPAKADSIPHLRLQHHKRYVKLIGAGDKHFWHLPKMCPNVRPRGRCFYGTLSLLLFFGIILRGFGNLNSFFDDGAASWLKWPLD
jgi:hypothetical protein